MTASDPRRRDQVGNGSHLLVARNVRRYRQERGLTISGLAARSGLAKQTLSKLEQGGGNPTVETLALIAGALDVPVRRLLTEWGTPVFVQRVADGVYQPGNSAHERVLDEIYGSGYVRTTIVRVRRKTDGSRPISAHAAGSLHHLFVIGGKLRTGPVTEPVDVGQGDFVRFPGDVPHLLQALSDTVDAHLVTTEPQVRQIRG